MTSNLGFNNDKNNVGFNKLERNKEEMEKLLNKFFKPEFLNRIDEVVYFNNLTQQDYKKIANNYIQSYKNQCLFEFVYPASGAKNTLDVTSIPFKFITLTTTTNILM